MKTLKNEIPYSDLRNWQEISGAPMYPLGHVQTASCLKTLQFAFGAHTLGAAQGLMHFKARHAV